MVNGHHIYQIKIDATSDGGLSPKHPETFMRLGALYAAIDGDLASKETPK